MRLIDADALIDKLPKEYSGSTVHLLINNAPTVSADSVEVVRCKGCVWGKEWNDKQIFCDRILMRLRENDFCSYGERSEE